MPCYKINKRVERGWRDYLHPLKVLLIGTLVAASAAACGSGGGSGTGSESATKLTVGFTQEPADWNFLRNSSTAVRSLLFYNVLEPLIEQNEDGSFKPLLAESYQVDTSGTQYTFKTRDAHFHTGAPVTAADVVYSLNAAKSSTLSTISGPLSVVRQVEELDPRTVRVTLTKPSQAFLTSISKDVAIIPQGSAESLSKNPVGTGPFVFSDWQHGVRVSLTSNENYWGAKPKIREVTWRFFTDKNAALNALLAHDVDVMPAVQSKQQVRKAEATPGLASDPVSGSEIGYISLNAKDSKLQNPAVRQAIAYAVDRNTFVQGIDGIATPTCAMVNPPNQPWNTNHCPYPYDPARARQLLASVGIQNLTLQFPYIGSSYSTWMQIVSQQLKDVGVTLEPINLDLATYVDRVLTKTDYEATVISGPQQIDSWKCPGFFTGACLKQFDDLLARADTAKDRTQWADLRRQAVELHADQAYLIPLATIGQSVLHTDQVTGIKRFSVASEFDLRAIRWVDGK
ncbi:peptide/nickel transport system substrate-binding protein [Amycolatopsis bartoniae]|uniref:Peptide ABC transporter substrate-binding protein n=1 Tax=Amycolatopsis bartoniae TaxID=941986 RepID=A0A8H9J1R5_9PSEU|nr:ABC transporter substrate-binding protein [Amycolatopsis bartoniae]MBB2933547.1 peptide/nickel transport system substrate-binding protein [Amycolatopsis bartoniae]TVT10730.1 ABC transporter substrate-binding protein [Amycolatopsis bartoniae]GHF73358.1 peptide ABC transporter substrate-binding protein [Amycolatopsis bartoniae]